MSEDAKPVLFEYAGHEVRHTHKYEFAVSGPAFENANKTVYETAAQAREAIDRRNKALCKQERVKAAVAIDAIAENGEPCVIRGIHMNTSDLIGPPKEVSGYRAHTLAVYAPAPWVIPAMKRMMAAKKEAERLRDLLSRIEIRSAGHGRIDEYEYDKKIETLQKNAAEALATALSIDPRLTP